jgi:hypothetical protein
MDIKEFVSQTLKQIIGGGFVKFHRGIAALHRDVRKK